MGRPLFPLVLLVLVVFDLCAGSYLYHVTYDSLAVGPYTTKAQVQSEWTGASVPGYSTPPDSAFIVDGPKAYNGGKSLKLVYFKGWDSEHKPGNYKVNFPVKYNELYYSIKIRTEDDFDGKLGGKLPGLCGGTCNSGGSPPNGTDGWSARNMWRYRNASVVQYCYRPNQNGTYPRDQPWNVGGTWRALRPGQWHTLEHRIVMNTPGKPDGIIQGWFDGQLAINATNMLWRTVDTLKIDSFYFSTFFGGSNSSWAPLKNETIYFDEVIISTTPITHGGASTPAPTTTKAATPAPTTTLAVTPAPTTTKAVTPAPTTTKPPPTTTAATPTLPAQVLNLLKWKLTLPIGTAGNPTEVKQPALATYVHARHFHLNSAATGVVFMAPTDGVTTSGSNFPRSELREMGYSDGSATCTGCAGWSTTKGTHTMVIVQAVTSLPARKEGVVVGQIHDSSDDVIKIQVKRTGFNTTSYRLQVTSSSVLATLNTNYVLGSRFTVKIVASGGKIQISYNGAVKLTINRTATACYFKAGVYTQSNPSYEKKGIGKVTIYDLDITHSSTGTVLRAEDSSAPSHPSHSATIAIIVTVAAVVVGVVLVAVIVIIIRRRNHEKKLQENLGQPLMEN